jgi:hypothetical protein
VLVAHRRKSAEHDARHRGRSRLPAFGLLPFQSISRGEKMRLIRMISLAAVAALVAISAVGVASASAEVETVLCKTNEEKCKGSNYIGYAFTANATGVKFKFSELGTTTQCSSTMVRGESESISLSFSSCTEGCTVTAKSLSPTANLSEPVAGSGKLTINSVSLGVKCGTSECVYSSSLEKLPLTGGTPAVIKVNNTLTEAAKSILCSKSVAWEGEYKLAAATAFVTKRATGPVFCTVNKAPCPAESIRLKPEFRLLTKTNFVFIGLNGTSVSCTESGFRLSNVEIHEPKDTWNYEALAIAGCSTVGAYTGCTVAMEGSPFTSTLEPSGETTGVISVSASPKTPTLNISCKLAGAPFTCKYTSTGFSIKFFGGEPAKLATIGVPYTKLSGPTVCFENGSVTAEYQGATDPVLFMTSS